MTTIDKGKIGLAGELRVASELLKRGYDASITFGNSKATDIMVFGKNNRFIRIEVKTSKNNRNFVTGYFPKYSNPVDIFPDVWVMYLPEKNGNTNGDRFYILTHGEVGDLQLVVNKGIKTEKGKGCDNIPVKFFEEKNQIFENRWELIQDILSKI